LALAISVTQHWADLKRLHVIGTITASGNYVTGGDTLNFTNPKIKSSKVPDIVTIHGRAVGPAYLYQFVCGTTQANGKMIVADVATGAELAAAPYPAGVTGDTIEFHAVFKKLV